MKWTVETFNAAVEDELDALPVDVRHKIVRFRLIIEAHGPQALPLHATKHLEDKLWELRIIGRDGIARIIYLKMSGRRLVLLHAFIKKTQKTPAGALEKARMRARSLISGH